MSVAIVSQLLALLTIIAQVASVVLILTLFFPKALLPIGIFTRKYGMLLAFIVVLIATAGSLFYSEIAGYKPCLLCWYQRIFMYPQVILLGMGLWLKDKGIAIYSIALSIIGFFIALYHYLLQIGVTNIAPCSAVGYSASCSQHFVMSFGYITIPLMAFSAFVFSVLLLIVSRRFEKRR